jgi:hypothetical protein
MPSKTVGFTALETISGFIIMANPPTSAPPIKLTPKTHTTRRGIATASFCLGLWGTLVFWWYPFGLTIASIGTTLALISIVMGWRAGKDGEHLAWLGLFFGITGIHLALLAYRFAQMAFEGTIPKMLP